MRNRSMSRFVACHSALALVALTAWRAATHPDASFRDPARHGRASARTVFDGTRVEEFKAHILGVIENVIGHAAQPDPGAARRRSAGEHRRHRRA